MSDWRYRFRDNASALSAALVFVVIFGLYVANHPAGFSANVVQTAANKGVLLALVAVGQTFVVLTAGIDLSVGAVFILADCLASAIVQGSPVAVALGVAGVLLTGLACGAINGALVIYGRLQPIVATIATLFFVPVVYSIVRGKKQDNDEEDEAEDSSAAEPELEPAHQAH